MNRRSFFRRAGAALFTAPAIIEAVGAAPPAGQWVLNPEWVALGPEANLVLLSMTPNAFTRFTVGPMAFPDNAGDCIMGACKPE